MPPRPSRPTRCDRPLPVAGAPEAFAGSAVVTELAGVSGLVLWKVLQDVTHYLDAAPDARLTMFPPGLAERRQREIAVAALPAEVGAPLEAMRGIVAAPADPAARVAAGRGAEGVARWAGEIGAGRTRTAFLEAAARLLESAGLAYQAGRIARAAGDMPRAEGWFRTAIRLGRETDWEHYTLAHLALASACSRTGNLAAAGALAARARRAAARHRLKHLRGLALHELMIVAAKQHAEAVVYETADLALREYGPAHPRLPALAHDVAGYWLDSGRFARSLLVFEALLPRISDPVEHVCVVANLVLASAGAGARERYERYWLTAAQLVAAVPNSSAAEVWLGLSEAARLVGDWEHADAAAGRAIDLADLSGAKALRQRAEEALAACGVRRRDAEHGLRDEAPGLARTADQLARSLAHVLGLGPPATQ